MEQRNLLLSRTRRGANKKSKGGNSKKNSKSQKPKKSKNSSKSKNEPEAERISSRRPSKEQPKKTGKPSKGGNKGSPSGQSGAGRISGKQKNRPEDFKSCTATMITPKCILTTAACTGKSKNVNLFAKIGERLYGSDVSFCYATVKIDLFVQYIFTIPFGRENNCT